MMLWLVFLPAPRFSEALLGSAKGAWIIPQASATQYISTWSQTNLEDCWATAHQEAVHRIEREKGDYINMSAVVL